jgi:hypothetical protein
MDGMPEMSWTFSIGEVAVLLMLAGLGVAAVYFLRDLSATIRGHRTDGAAGESIPRWEANRPALPDQEPGRGVPPDTALGRSGCPGAETALDEDMVSKLAVAVSVLVQHVEISGQGDKGPEGEVLDAIRQSCLTIVESIWLKELQEAYDASKQRREAAYKRSTSVRELRDCIKREDSLLRADIDRLSRHLEEMLDATQGRYAKASRKLSEALERVLS